MGEGGIKYYFYCHSLFLFPPTFFFVSGFIPVNEIAEYTPSEHLFLTLKEDGLEVSYISWYFPRPLGWLEGHGWSQSGFLKPRKA